MGGQAWELLLGLFSLIGFFVALNYLQKILDRTRLGSGGWMALLLWPSILLIDSVLIYLFVKGLFWEGNLWVLMLLFVILPLSFICLMPLAGFKEWLNERKHQKKALMRNKQKYR